MEENMQSLQHSSLSNRELILACDNAWTMAGLPSELQYELYKRFCAIAPINEHPLHDDKQLDLFV